MATFCPEPLPLFDEALAPPPAPALPAVPLAQIFAEEYRALRPRAPLPAMQICFYRFARLNNTARLRAGALLVRLSDLLVQAPESVLRALAHILLAKLYRKPVAARAAARFRQYAGSAAISRSAETVRRARGRKNFVGARGRVYDLNEVFQAVNARFFDGLMAAPALTWSVRKGRRILGHYDAAHHVIVVSRLFDGPNVPRAAIEYLMFHEMLHLRHPVKLRGGRRCVHSAAFRREEQMFPNLAAVRQILKTL